MELTKAETTTLILALGTAIEKETHSLQDLIRENIEAEGMANVIQERQRHLANLDQLRRRFIES
jgi:hypothetical protein